MKRCQIKDVRLVPVDTDTYTLIENAKAVASVAGTAPGGFSRKTWNYIYPWYRNCHGIFKLIMLRLVSTE